jgi:hypothetical protein|tara:strand:+ start:210 stop:557 length:348 start_codon:yes stop_codon:yes gene_type:complete
MITRNGREDLRDYIITQYTVAKVGTGGDSTNPNASDLDSPVGASISSITAVSSGETSVDFKFTISGSAYVGHTIKEVGIFNKDSPNEMLLRVNYDSIGPLTSTDNVEFIITMEVD